MERSLGRYRLLSRLGQGGMGDVYLARAEGPAGFEKLVALKIISGRNDERRVTGLQREAIIGAGLDHENVVGVLDLAEDQGRQFVVMEYVRGFTLKQVVSHLARQKGAVPIQCAVHVARTVAGALEYVHGLRGPAGELLGLLHGDVSGSNVLLSADGRIKLADFGIAGFSADLHALGTIVGKPWFLPREAFRGGPRVQAWDVYALGVMLYQALAGALPFPGGTMTAVRLALARGSPPVTNLRADCPWPLARVVEQAIDPEPAIRFHSAGELRAALDDAWPRRVDDADALRALVDQVFRDEEFVREYGELPAAAGPSTRERAPRMADEEMPTAVTPAHPPVRLGLSPARGVEAARRYGDQLAGQLGAALDREVRPMVYADYHALVDCLSRGEVDVAWMPPLPFLDAADRGAGTLAIALRHGRTFYESAIIVRADSGIERLEELRGKSAAWVDPESASGYVFPQVAILRRLGSPKEVLSRESFHGSHRAVCEAVANGWAAAGATYAVRDAAGVLHNSGWTDLLAERAGELRAIEYLGPIPSDTIAHRPHLPAELARQITAALLGMKEEPGGRALLTSIFGADELVPGELRFYDEMRQALVMGTLGD